MDRPLDFTLFVTTIRSGHAEWMLYCVEKDHATGRSLVLDHTMKPIRIEKFLADKKSQEVAGEARSVTTLGAQTDTWREDRGLTHGK